MKRVFIPSTTSLEEIERIAALFEKVDDGIGAQSLAALGFAKLPQRAKLRPYNSMQKVDGEWNGMCAYVYESLSGEPHPGSKAIGAGFREKEYGKHVAELLRQWAETGRVNVMDETIPGEGKWRRLVLYYKLCCEENPFLVRGFTMMRGFNLGEYKSLNLAVRGFEEAYTAPHEEAVG